LHYGWRALIYLTLAGFLFCLLVTIQPPICVTGENDTTAAGFISIMQMKMKKQQTKTYYVILWNAWIGLSSVLRPRQRSIGYVGDGFYETHVRISPDVLPQEHHVVPEFWTSFQFCRCNLS